MAILSANQIRFSYGSTPVIKSASFLVDDGDKVGIVGPNGAGKSTLLRLIAGELRVDEGMLHVRRGTEIGYLEQNIPADDTDIFTFCEEIFSDIAQIEQRLRELERNMATNADAATMSEYGELLELFSSKNGYAIRSKVNAVLNGLKTDGSRRLSELSGGERSKVATARLLLRNPELLILDEPTNHLDIDSVAWMEDFLTNYAGTVFVVSHDRYFLDKVCNKILHFEAGSAVMYRGSYREVIRQIMERKAYRLKLYERQQKEIARQEGIIREFYSRATEKQIKKAKSRQKLLDRMERIEKPTEDRTKFNLRLHSSGRGGNEVLIIQDIHKSFGEDCVLRGASLSVFRGDKIGLIGGNGTGKTTLFRIVLGEQEADGGSVKFGAGIDFGYFAQNMEQLDPSKTIPDEIHDAHPGMTISEVRGVLGAFLFKDNLDRKIGELSGGEKNRVQLLKLMMSPANLLLLDEPTNHLDTYAKEILDQALTDYEGSAVIISHDRFFLNTVCNKIAVLREGRIEVFPGNYEDYLYTKHIRESGDPAKSGTGVGKNGERGGRDKNSGKTEENGDRKREKSGGKTKGKSSKHLPPVVSKKAIEKEIMALEERLSELETARYLEENYTDFRKSQEIADEIEALNERCEALYAKLME